MARKSKRRPAQRRPRPAAAAPAVAAPGQPAAVPQRSAQGARTGGQEALVRSVEMSLAPRAANAARRGQRGILIGDDDPAIPLDRVPYFTSDLARLGVTAALMLVLLVAGAQLVPLVTH
jgi:hypothetical protein